MGFYVTRQRYFDTNQLVVEISSNGKKGAGPDVLTARYEGEGKNLKSPIDAVNVATRILAKWHVDYHDENKKLCIIDSNFKDGRMFYDMTKRDLDRAKAWAELTYKNLTKCGGCAKPIGQMKNPVKVNEMQDLIFCCEYCASKRYRDMTGLELQTMKPNQKKKA